MQVTIFFCYAREDEALLKKLKTHLRPLQRQGLIDVWYDRDIRAGTEWQQEIKEHLNSAQIVLLLVSPDFMDSDYCYSIEMQRALERHARGQAKVIPIILRPVYWQGEPLGKLQALPTDGKPVTGSDWYNLDSALYDVTKGIYKVVMDFTSPAVPGERQKEIAKPSVITPVVQHIGDGILRSDKLVRPDADNNIISGTTPPHDRSNTVSSIEELQEEMNYIGKFINVYRIEREIGRGGLGHVYLARPTQLPGRTVAIKLFYSHLSEVLKEGLLFQQTQLLEKLKHPYVLPIIDVGIQGKSHYIVTEYAPKGSLRDRIQHQYQQPLPVQEAVAILSQIGQALAHIHQLNIVHRDIKPANILFNERGEAQLTDFDIAVMLDSGSSKKVNVMGSPPYMAPEQFEGTISRKSDQYALGCLAYELCTGRRAFDSPNFISMQFMHTVEKPIAPRQFNQELPVHIEEAILKAMAKNEADRLSGTLAFVSALNTK